MDKPAPSVAHEIETLKELYTALNRNDTLGVIKAYDPQIEWTEPPEAPGAGTYRGQVAVAARVSQARGTWAEGSCEPERFIPAGDKVVVFVHVHVRLKDQTDWIDARLADVYTFRNGKVTQLRSFGDMQKALEWAGVRALDGN